MRLPRARGFTLLEVMVALAIVSIGLIAAFNGIIQMAHSSATLRDRALADWIAMNQITEIRISGEFPEVGSRNGEVFFADRPWRWEARVSETGVTDLRRIDLYVMRDAFPEDPVTIMSGFVSRSPAGMAGSIDWWGAGVEAVGEGGEQEVSETEQEPRGRQQRTPRQQAPEDDDE